MKVRISGFTLIEMLIVVTVIGILAAVIYANFGDAGKQSRDSQRKADLRLVQNALELYKEENGRYPAGCNGVNWSGEQGTNYACGGSDAQYIVGLAPKYIPVLPKDPKKGSGDYGYVYRTNADGTVYKFVARKSVESEELASVTSDFEFKACDIVADHAGAIFQTTAAPNECTTWPEYINSKIPIEGPRCSLGVCNRYSNGVGGFNQPAPECTLANIGTPVGGDKTSYAVWGGYADVTGGVGGSDDLKIEYNTERVLCDMPN